MSFRSWSWNGPEGAVGDGSPVSVSRGSTAIPVVELLQKRFRRVWLTCSTVVIVKPMSLSILGQSKLMSRSFLIHQT
eukprot:3187445-Rhodomonas_salina.1